MTVREMRKRLVGRKIVGFEANAFRDGRATRTGKLGAITYDPVFVLDNGTRVSFHVRETDVGEYGINPKISEAT